MMTPEKLEKKLKQLGYSEHRKIIPDPFKLEEEKYLNNKEFAQELHKTLSKLYAGRNDRK